MYHRCFKNGALSPQWWASQLESGWGDDSVGLKIRCSRSNMYWTPLALTVLVFQCELRAHPANSFVKCISVREDILPLREHSSAHLWAHTCVWTKNKVRVCVQHVHVSILYLCNGACLVPVWQPLLSKDKGDTIMSVFCEKWTTAKSHNNSIKLHR